MEKIILITFHALFGGTAAMFGGFIGYVFSIQLVGNHGFLPFLGFGVAALISMFIYMRSFKIPGSRAVSG